MILTNIKKIKHISLYIFIALFFLINLLLLTKYPFIHSDESWLSGLSRTISEKNSFNTIESFYDLYPRAVHGLRIIFVSIQILFIKIFGYSIFSMRLISLVFTLLSLWILYKIFYKISKSEIYSLLITIVISVNMHFIMTSHIARQEPIILLGMILSYYLIEKHELLTASIIGILIGVHPNSFFIACGVSLIYLFLYLNSKISFKQLLNFILVLFTFSLFFIILSISINPNFIKDYLAFGESLGVLNYHVSRFDGFFYYYKKLFLQIGGTYNLVNIKFDLFILLFNFIYILFYTIINIIKIFKKIKITYSKDIIYPFLMILGINLGYILVGRYNQTAIIFTLVFSYICFFSIINYHFNKQKKIMVLILLLLLSYQGYNSYKEITATNYEDYEILGNHIKNVIPRDANVLANLNLDYHFENNKLYDYRNLYYLKNNNLEFHDYINKNNIKYIILYEEMEYIYNASPKWDALYGNLYYYEDMMLFLNTNCVLVDVFENPTYGMRIAKYVDVYPWYTKIYKIQED
jgi:hypothetical protein